MCIEQVGTGAVLYQHGERFPCLVAVEQARPQADGPGAAPTGIGASGGQAPFQGNPGSIGQLGGFTRSDFATRVERIEVRHVPLAGSALLEIAGPLLQLTVAASAKRNQTAA